MYIEAIQNMYDRVSTNIQTPVGIIVPFQVKVGLHQESALSPFIFTVTMEEIYKSIWETVPWCMLFADDIVPVAATREDVSNKLDEWREALKGKGLRIYRTKTEYLCCDFSGTSPVGEPEVSINEEVVKSTTKYKYLRSIIQRDREIDGDGNHCIHAGWLKWRAATTVLCDREFPSKLKGKFYRAAIGPALLYGTEYWPVKKIFEHKIEVTEMRILKWMCEHTLMDRIRNQEFRDKLGVAPISGKMRENRLRWFGHVQRKTFDAPVRRVEIIIVEGMRSRGRLKRTWDEQIRIDLYELNLSEGLTRDRVSWRRHIHVLDY